MKQMSTRGRLQYAREVPARDRARHLHNCLKSLPGTSSSVRVPLARRQWLMGWVGGLQEEVEKVVQAGGEPAAIEAELEKMANERKSESQARAGTYPPSKKPAAAPGVSPNSRRTKPFNAPSIH